MEHSKTILYSHTFISILMELSKAAEERLTVSHFFCLRMEHLQKGSMSLLTKRDNTTFALGLADPEGLVCCLCHCSTGASLSSVESK